MGVQMPPDDRRRAERVNVNPQFEELSGAAFVRDLSERGAFVHTEAFCPVGTLVDLRFTVIVDDPVVLRARGRVVRHSESPRGMGIEFTDLMPVMVLRIHDIIGRQRPLESGPPRSIGAPGRRTIVGDRAAARHGAGENNDDPVESAETLVNLKPIDMEIIDDDDLPSDVDPGSER